VARLLVLLPLVVAASLAAGADGGRKAPPLVATNGVVVDAGCHGSRPSDVHRRTADGAFLAVSLSRVGCAVRAVAVALRDAPAGAWLYLGTPDIYTIGRFETACSGSVLSTVFRLDARSATASVRLEATGVQREVTLQPGQRMRSFPLPVLLWTVRPGGEAGWTTAHVVEVARPGCHVDIRALLVAFRTGG
jgi:hypothetical protein